MAGHYPGPNYSQIIGLIKRKIGRKREGSLWALLTFFPSLAMPFPWACVSHDQLLALTGLGRKRKGMEKDLTVGNWPAYGRKWEGWEWKTLILDFLMFKLIF